MFGLNVTALLIYRVFGRFGAFHILSVINLVRMEPTRAGWCVGPARTE